MLLEDVLAALKQRGIRLTPQRQEIVGALLDRLREGGLPLNAEEVLQRVRVRYPGVSLDTVYRNLATLQGSGLVNEVNFRDDCRRFELVEPGRHHHHLVCLCCGGSQEVPFCPVNLAEIKNSYPEFKIEDHTFTVYGYCAQCIKNKKKEK